MSLGSVEGRRASEEAVARARGRDQEAKDEEDTARGRPVDNAQKSANPGKEANRAPVESVSISPGASIHPGAPRGGIVMIVKVFP